jgi:hypothetical protein
MAYSGPCAALYRNLVIGRKHAKMRSRPIATATSGLENETLAAVPAPAIGTASPITRTPPGDPGS